MLANKYEGERHPLLIDTVPLRLQKRRPPELVMKPILIIHPFLSSQVVMNSRTSFSFLIAPGQKRPTRSADNGTYKQGMFAEYKLGVY